MLFWLSYAGRSCRALGRNRTDATGLRDRRSTFELRGRRSATRHGRVTWNVRYDHRALVRIKHVSALTDRFRAGDGERSRLNQLGKLARHQAASPAKKEVPSRLSNAELGNAPRLIVASTIARDRRPGSRVPVFLVEVRGIEPPIPASQTPCLTVRPHLENSLSRIRTPNDLLCMSAFVDGMTDFLVALLCEAAWRGYHKSAHHETRRQLAQSLWELGYGIVGRQGIEP